MAEFVERNGPRFTAQERAAARREALLMAETGMSQMEIANHFDVNQSVIHVWLKKERGDKHYMALRAADKIREQLVCCDIFDQIEALHGDLLAQQQLREDRKRFHDICYFGEWAARIASDVR